MKDAPIRDTCQNNLIEEGFEGFSTVRCSYLAESTGSCRDQVHRTLFHGEKLRFTKNSKFFLLSRRMRNRERLLVSNKECELEEF